MLLVFTPFLTQIASIVHRSPPSLIATLNFVQSENKGATTMFEARITEGKIFKQIIDAIKDLVQDANMDCSNDGISIQSMDSSHVSLVAVHLNSNGLDHYRCDRAQNLGFNSANLSKILKCANNEDIITLKADDSADNLTLLFESPKNSRIADFGECIFVYFGICNSMKCFSHADSSHVSHSRAQIDGH